MLNRLTIAAIITGLAVLATTSAADAASCAAITAAGRAANPQNYDPPKLYDAEKLARSRAIAAWRDKVQTNCSGYTSYWWLSRKRTVVCEGYAGGIMCEVTATPLKKPI